MLATREQKNCVMRFQDFSESDMGDDAVRAPTSEEEDEGEAHPQQSDNDVEMDDEERLKLEERRTEREREQQERRRIRALKSKYKGIRSLMCGLFMS